MSLRALQWCVIRLFINELTNEWMNWLTSLVQTRPMIRMIRPRSQFELVSFIEWSQRNVSFWWMSIVSGHFDDHSLFLSLMTDSLSGIAFTIVMLTWWLKSLGWSLNQMMTIVFSEVLDSGGRLTAQWVSEWELLLCSWRLILGCFDEWFWITAEQKRSTAVYTSNKVWWSWFDFLVYWRCIGDRRSEGVWFIFLKSRKSLKIQLGSGSASCHASQA